MKIKKVTLAYILVSICVLLAVYNGLTVVKVVESEMYKDTLDKCIKVNELDKSMFLDCEYMIEKKDDVPIWKGLWALLNINFYLLVGGMIYARIGIIDEE